MIVQPHHTAEALELTVRGELRSDSHLERFVAALPSRATLGRKCVHIILRVTNTVQPDAIERLRAKTATHYRVQSSDVTIEQQPPVELSSTTAVESPD